jgi:uroporphyrinogen decarboxylase
VYSILHVCGNAEPALPDLIECGLDCLQSLQPEAMDVYALKKNYGKDLRLWGGLGSQSVLPFGKPDEVKREIRKLKTEMGRGGGYVLSGAKALDVGDVPFANVVAYYEEALQLVDRSGGP